ncbi:MAG TPA: TonB C-terminal domain-containing protein [Longimicrobiaceae bacterium]|nr:TonB C-terminal domain-containing protein [Longimicrobiaceae bacterium]
MNARERRPQGRPLRWAIVTSVLLHGGVIALLLAATTQSGERLPKMRVYAVDIVSPPPQAAGEYDPLPGGPAPAPVETKPAEPVTPPEPKPTTPPPPPAPAKEPSPAPKATEKPAEKPAPAKPAPKPATQKSSSKTSEKPSKSETGTGKSTPSKGARPDASSPGGSGLDVHLKGVQCPSPDYCANIVEQLYRYFRPPAGATTDAAEVFFRINADGSVSDMKVVHSVGAFSFTAAALEAVEQAGLHKAFGRLPREFQLDQLPVQFFFRPAR